jgi:hypothetical protein
MESKTLVMIIAWRLGLGDGQYLASSCLVMASTWRLCLVMISA